MPHDPPSEFPTPSNNRYLRLTIEDDGLGATPEAYRRLNDPLDRGFSGRENGQGYALGAFKDYVGGVGGRLMFEPSSTGGFRVVLDLRRIETTPV